LVGIAFSGGAMICMVMRQIYLGIAIDTAFPAPRSVIQIVSPTGSTSVGVSSPSFVGPALWNPLQIILKLDKPFAPRCRV